MILHGASFVMWREKNKRDKLRNKYTSVQLHHTHVSNVNFTVELVPKTRDDLFSPNVAAREDDRNVTGKSEWLNNMGACNGDEVL